MNVTIKGLPSRVYQKLKMRAYANRRSLNSEVIDILAKAVESHPIDLERLLPEIQRVRRTINGPPLDEKFLRAAKDRGRP